MLSFRVTPGTVRSTVARQLVICGLLLGLIGGGLSAEGFAQGTKKKRDLQPPRNETLLTRDNVNIHITYFKSSMGSESPVIILLHMKDGNRFVWQNGFAERLQAAGYAVITVDLRGHGESKGGFAGVPAANKKGGKKGGRSVESTELRPADYVNMVAEDLEAVKKFIFDEHQAENLNMNKIGIVGPEMGASIAAYFALDDWYKRPYPDGQIGYRTPRGQDVRALVLASPQNNVPGLPISKPLTDLRNPQWGVAFLVCVGKKDTQDRGLAKKLYTQLTAFPKSEERMYFEEYNSKLRGTELLGKNLRFEEHMLAFFDKTLKGLPDNWRDRRSKLDRKE